MRACRDFTNDMKSNRILKQQTKEKEEISAEITVELQQEEPLDKECAVSQKKL